MLNSEWSNGSGGATINGEQVDFLLKKSLDEKSIGKPPTLLDIFLEKEFPEMISACASNTTGPAAGSASYYSVNSASLLCRQSFMNHWTAVAVRVEREL